MLERRGIVGGAAITEEFHPGFRNSVASYSVSLLNPKIIRDMDLARHGLKIVLRTISYFSPLDDGRYLIVDRDKQRTAKELGGFSTSDVGQYAAYNERLDTIVDLLRTVLMETPPNAGGGLRDLLGALTMGNRVRGLGLEGQRDLIDFFAKSAGDILDSWFETDALKGILGFDAITGAYASPYTPGTAYVLLHHVFGEVNGIKGAWGHAIGGMGAITQAMAKACAEAGVEIRTDSPVREVILDKGNARRRRAEGRYKRSAAASSCRTSIPNCSMAALSPAARCRPISWSESAIQMRIGHVPDECRAVGVAEFHRTPDERRDGPSRRQHDDRSVAELPRRGLHGRASFRLGDEAGHRNAYSERAGRQPGAEGPARREPVLPACRAGICRMDRAGTIAARHVADVMIDTITRYAPNFRGSVIGRMILSPLDMERKLGAGRRRYLPRPAQSRSALQRTPGAGAWQLSRAAEGTLYVRLVHASWRRRDRASRPQCGARDHPRFQTRARAEERPKAAVRKLGAHRRDGAKRHRVPFGCCSRD